MDLRSPFARSQNSAILQGRTGEEATGMTPRGAGMMNHSSTRVGALERFQGAITCRSR
jgi:hypothetical protein